MGWQTFAVISAIAAGATAVFAKAGLESVPAHLGNAVRTAVVFALCLPVLWWSGEYSKTATLSGKAWLLLALSAATTAVSWVAYFKALSLGAATSVTAVDKASLVVTLVLSTLFLSVLVAPVALRFNRSPDAIAPAIPTSGDCHTQPGI
jgi:transporter family protein